MEFFFKVRGRIQSSQVIVRMKDKADRIRKPWLTMDMEALLVVKATACVWYRQMGLSKSHEEYLGCRSTLKIEIRRTKRGHETGLT